MKIFQPHPYSQIFRKMTDSEKSEFFKDIKENGQRVKGLIYEGLLLDGNQRQAGCIEAGIEFQWKEFRGNKEEALKEVASLNLHRRHLTDSERACTGAEMSSLFPRTNAYTAIKNGVRGRSGPMLSKLLNVSQRKIREAIFIKKNEPDLFEKCKNGEIKVGPTFKSIYRDLNESGKLKVPTMFSSDFDISNFASIMCKNDGWQMKLRIIEGQYHCQFFGVNGVEERRLATMEAFQSMKHAVVWAIKLAMDTYPEKKEMVSSE